MKRFYLVLTLVLSLTCGKGFAVEPTSLELFTLAFGTMNYSMDSAVESLLKEIKSPVQVTLKPLPSILYISKYYSQNIEKMRSGEKPYFISTTTANAVPYMAQGFPPYEEFPMDGMRILCVVGGFVHPMTTFDQNLKTPADLKGKKVALPEKARANQCTLPNVPVYDNAYGGFDKVNWQYLGAANGKDAYVNGSVDVYWGSAIGEIVPDADGNLVMTKANADPSLLEALSTGKANYFVSEEPEVLKTAYGPKDMAFLPVKVPAGTLPNQTEDFWAKGSYTVLMGDKSLSDEVVAQFVCDLFQNKERLADYYASFAYMGNPYPIGSDSKWVHPGLFKAMERMGMDLPEGVTKP